MERAEETQLYSTGTKAYLLKATLIALIEIGSDKNSQIMAAQIHEGDKLSLLQSSNSDLRCSCSVSRRLWWRAAAPMNDWRASGRDTVARFHRGMPTSY